MTLLSESRLEVVSDTKVESFVAIDPGSRHVGYALFRARTVGITAQGWSCVFARETQPAGLHAWLIDQLDREGSALESAIEEVVIEDFAINLELLKKAKGGAQSKDANETIECIGAVRLICALAKRPMIRQQPSAQHAALRALPDIGIVSEKQLTSVGHGPHAKSAELHGWWRIIGRMKGKGARRVSQLWAPGEGGVVGGKGVW